MIAEWELVKRKTGLEFTTCMRKQNSDIWKMEHQRKEGESIISAKTASRVDASTDLVSEMESLSFNPLDCRWQALLFQSLSRLIIKIPSLFNSFACAHKSVSGRHLLSCPLSSTPPPQCTHTLNAVFIHPSSANSQFHAYINNYLTLFFLFFPLKCTVTWTQLRPSATRKTHHVQFISLVPPISSQTQALTTTPNNVLHDLFVMSVLATPAKFMHSKLTPMHGRIISH